MIPCSDPLLQNALLQNENSQTERWQQQMKNLITTPEELLQRLQLKDDDCQKILLACRDFPLRVPRSYVDRMEPSNPKDPLLLQVLPQAQELLEISGFSKDPLQEEQSNCQPGLIHKYQGRVLLLVSSYCPIHCRYCFRRHFPYEQNNNNRAQWQKTLEYIRCDASIKEVIYSGGDPLSASDKQLHWLTTEIAKIPHVIRLRVHTRLPIVIPQRITDECIQWLTSTRLKTSVVVHVNHPQELDQTVGHYLNLLTKEGVTLLNQTVLLRQINDSVDTLAQLSETLFDYGVLPYYLHLLDKVEGAAHFYVPAEEACQLHDELRKRLSGYLLPRLVFEQGGQAAKMPINS